jgi:hypothetical protein
LVQVIGVRLYAEHLPAHLASPELISSNMGAAVLHLTKVRRGKDRVEAKVRRLLGAQIDSALGLFLMHVVLHRRREVQVMEELHQAYMQPFASNSE